MRPDVLAMLHEYSSTLPDGAPHDRLARPRKMQLCRKTARLLRPDILPTLQEPPPPSASLRGHTVAEAMRVYPEVDSTPSLSSGSSGLSIPRNGLPLQATIASARHSSLRLGDEVHSWRTRSTLQALRSSSSVHLLRNSASMSSLPGRERRGHALLVSGGTPLRPASQRSLLRLQTELLMKSQHGALIPLD